MLLCMTCCGLISAHHLGYVQIMITRNVFGLMNDFWCGRWEVMLR